MAFENVSSTSLQNAINACESSLNNSTTKTLISNLESNSTWQTKCKNNLITALNNLNNKRYQDLKNTLNKYKSIPPLIQEYQNLEKQNEMLNQRNNSLSQENSNLNGRLYHTVNDTKTVTDEFGFTHEENDGSHQEKDTGVESQINNNSNEINSNNTTISNNTSRMQQIINLVESLI